MNPEQFSDGFSTGLVQESGKARSSVIVVGRFRSLDFSVTLCIDGFRGCDHFCTPRNVPAWEPSFVGAL